MFTSYYLIIKAFQNAMKNSRRAIGEDKERKIVKKNITVTLSFVLLWTPCILKLIYEALTARPVPQVVDAFAVLLGTFNSTLYPF
jgi:hypothetical protein